MSDDKQKNYKVEWSFDFDQLGEQIGDFFKSIGQTIEGRGEEQIKVGTFTGARDSAQTARVRLDLSIGTSSVRPLSAGSPNIIEADLTYIGDVTFVCDGEADKIIQLSQANTAGDWFKNVVGFIGSGRKLRWEIALSPDVPYPLMDINSGVGDTTADLSAFAIERLELNSGTGECHATLPASAESYSARINIGIGQTHLIVPSGAALDLDIRGGTGELELTIGDGARVNARMSGGLGETTIRLPNDAAVRLEASMGIGSLNIPPTLQRLSGGSSDFIGKSGVWQSANYTTSDHRITIQFDGGVGELNILA